MANGNVHKLAIRRYPPGYRNQIILLEGSISTIVPSVLVDWTSLGPIAIVIHIRFSFPFGYGHSQNNATTKYIPWCFRTFSTGRRILLYEILPLVLIICRRSGVFEKLSSSGARSADAGGFWPVICHFQEVANVLPTFFRVILYSQISVGIRTIDNTIPERPYTTREDGFVKYSA